MAKLSIITICRNDEKYIARTIQSVLNQTFKDYQYIVVDNNSEDSTAEIVKRYADRIDVFIKEKKKGIFNTMNKGLKYAKGDYVLFLCGNDYLANSRVLEKAFSFNFKEDILHGYMQTPDGKIIKSLENTDIKKYLRRNTLPHEATFVKKKVLDKIGGFDESYKIAGDYDFFAKAVLKHGASTRYLPVLVSIFNLDGISSKKKEIVNQEKKIVQDKIIRKSRKKFKAKILIGIMHTIENEFEQCIKAINSQTYKNFDYFVIENLPNKEAHDRLYQTFMDNSKKYDLFIKIDADMVLSRNTFFEEAVEKMHEEKDVDRLTIAVHDFFTDSLISGLSIFRNNVSWKKVPEKIFVDRTENAKKTLGDRTELAPAAYHCPNPSNFQAFHFGLHKAVKVLQAGNLDFIDSASREHYNYILKLKENYKKSHKAKLGYALLGAVEGLKRNYSHKEVDFNSPASAERFEYYEKQSKKQFNKSVQKAIKYLDTKHAMMLYYWIILKSRCREKNALQSLFDIYFRAFKEKIKNREHGKKQSFNNSAVLQFSRIL